MITALILICSVAATACTRDNAATVIRVPSDCGTPATCFMSAQAYLAQTSLGRELGPDDQVKIVCVRSGNGAAEASPSSSLARRNVSQ
jgi:hypothetical protein